MSDHLFPVEVPDGRCGDWSVETFVITERDALYSSLRSGAWAVRPGTYKRLMCAGEVVMSNTYMEWRTNRGAVHSATGRVLVNGLGLGAVLTAMLKKPEVTEVWVVEKNREVIELVAPSFAQDARVKIIPAAALEFVPPKGVRFDCVWHDIWTHIDAKNLEDMEKLHRRYGRRTAWQDSWARDFCAMPYNQRPRF